MFMSILQILLVEISVYLTIANFPEKSDDVQNLIIVCTLTANSAIEMYKRRLPTNTVAPIDIHTRVSRAEAIRWKILACLPLNCYSIAGSFALHTLARCQTLEELQWTPGDIDIFYVDKTLDGSLDYGDLKTFQKKTITSYMFRFCECFISFVDKVKVETGISLNLCQSTGFTLQDYIDFTAVCSDSPIRNWIDPPGDTLVEYFYNDERDTVFHVIDCLLPKEAAVNGPIKVSFIIRLNLPDYYSDEFSSEDESNSSAQLPVMPMPMSIEDIMDTFDIDICQVSFTYDGNEIRFVMSDHVRDAISKKTMRVVNLGHRSTAHQIQKYTSRGFKLEFSELMDLSDLSDESASD